MQCPNFQIPQMQLSHLHYAAADWKDSPFEGDSGPPSATSSSIEGPATVTTQPQLPAKMHSEVQEIPNGGPCDALLFFSVMQVILLGFSVRVTRIAIASSEPEVQKNSLEHDSWIALLALEFTILTVLVSMAISCALGIYTGVLWLRRRNHEEGIQPVVRVWDAFFMHAQPFFQMQIRVFCKGTDLYGFLEHIDA
jgi:ABC-type anion transport system duplicated permease subunit